MQKTIDWISTNVVSGAYLVKDWLILNVGIGAGTGAVLDSDNIVDNLLEWAIGLSIVAFNIVRLVKYIQDMREKKKSKNEKAS